MNDFNLDDEGMRVIYKRKPFPFIVACIGAALMLGLWIFRLNSIAVVSAAYCCFVAAFMFIGVISKKRLNAFYFLGYIASCFGVTMYYIVWGVDASFFMRVLSNILLALPSFIIIVFAYFVSLFTKKERQVLGASVLSAMLIFSSIIYVFTMNLKSTPKAFDMQDGHDEYLGNINSDKTSSNSPNVLFILMDDLGYGDISSYGAIYDTPNIDSIAEDGLLFENFYSAYSVCSPSRFAALTGRYPYRGYADNVIYPTEKCYSPFSITRHMNSFEMGNNVDGMLSDEVTIAETLGAAGYDTAIVGKWHLGDYGEYLPTNQGFDYFYGSYQVNDMTPYYFVEEQSGKAVTDIDTKTLKSDQSIVTDTLYSKLSSWIRKQANATYDDDGNITGSNQTSPFFVYYSTPWPHAPLSVGKDYDGITGMGTYADCVTEFDAYLGKLFDDLRAMDLYDNTVIVFTSDNGPALQGSTGELRGGKYLAYEGGQKVPFLMKWKDGTAEIGATTGATIHISGAATLTDLFPTLVDLIGVSNSNGTDSCYLPSDVDREMDGLSMLPMMTGEVNYIHDKEHPILHMKRQVIKAVQYAIPTSEVISKTAELNNGDYNYADYDVINLNAYLQFKYFKNIQNDNSAFFDKFRKNWLHILTDDIGENYNRADMYPEIAAEMKQVMADKTAQFKNNRRGYYKEYYD